MSASSPSELGGAYIFDASTFLKGLRSISLRNLSLRYAEKHQTSVVYKYRPVGTWEHISTLHMRADGPLVSVQLIEELQLPLHSL